MQHPGLVSRVPCPPWLSDGFRCRRGGGLFSPCRLLRARLGGHNGIGPRRARGHECHHASPGPGVQAGGPGGGGGADGQCFCHHIQPGGRTVEFGFVWSRIRLAERGLPTVPRALGQNGARGQAAQRWVGAICHGVFEAGRCGSSILPRYPVLLRAQFRAPASWVPEVARSFPSDFGLVSWFRCSAWSCVHYYFSQIPSAYWNSCHGGLGWQRAGDFPAAVRRCRWSQAPGCGGGHRLAADDRRCIVPLRTVDV
mmetsp:Transcript_11578/g.26275  ORF Transcript_11578/g.26275 Transcript_11578/m.26275 type:complete len:254 (+) Transcript_11578:359-1120(+)